MNKPVWIASSAFALVAVIAGVSVSPRAARAQILSGFDVYRSNCDGCHELYDPESPKRTRAQWSTILTRMVKVRGATLNDREYGAVLNYLDSFNRVKREIKWIDTPAKSHKATFTVADGGKLPVEWVDLNVGGDEQVPWALQPDPAAKTAYLSPLKSAGENQFPVLIDNTGTMRNGSVSTRLQLLSGKQSVGAGVVFGFKNPQSYLGVRVSPRDVVLYEVTGGQRALIRRAPVAAPLKSWHTLAVETAGQQVTVSFDGKPLGALTTAVTSYQGGRVGVNTQSDTIALFDQWQVTVK